VAALSAAFLTAAVTAALLDRPQNVEAARLRPAVAVLF
jgi:hypothetical protein